MHEIRNEAADVAAAAAGAGAGVTVATLLDLGTGTGLVRRLAGITPGARFAGVAAAGGEMCFVIEGDGLLTADGRADLALGAGTGLLIPPGTRYQVRAGTGLRLDLVTLPGDGGFAPGGRVLARDLGECPVERTGDREFRVLFGPGRDCQVATQFVGEIPPGRAPDHSHPYDETVLVLQGTGVLHLGGRREPVTAGTCAHLPPGVPHCLENTGAGLMRVLGVFHPADSPATKEPR